MDQPERRTDSPAQSETTIVSERPDASRTAVSFFQSEREHLTLLPHVLKYFSLYELLQFQLVNRSWKAAVFVTCDKHINRLDMGQLWAVLGNENTAPISSVTGLISKFHAISDLNLAYCYHVSDSYLMDMIAALPRTDIVSRLDLYYCYQITDGTLEKIVALFPALETLNIGRCNKITNTGLKKLLRLEKLRSLNISHNNNFNDDTVTILEGGDGPFPSLKEVDMESCLSIDPKMLDEMKANNPHMKITWIPSAQARPQNPRNKTLKPPGA